MSLQIREPLNLTLTSGLLYKGLQMVRGVQGTERGFTLSSLLGVTAMGAFPFA